MGRRAFVSGSLGAAVAATVYGTGPSAEAQGSSPSGPRRTPVFELRRFRFRFGTMEARHGQYAKEALVPALNRLGIRPIGAFSVTMGEESPGVYMLLPHPDAESVVSLPARLRDDAEYARAAGSFRSLPASDPPYVRRESSLLLPFERFPEIVAPTGAQAAASRVFELRCYQSHNEQAHLKKVEMFERAGEIEIFRRVGLTPVFFGRDLIGQGLPSLTYLLVFKDATARESAWAAFRDDPEWIKLRSTPGFSNAEILTNIRTALLRPTDYSQM